MKEQAAVGAALNALTGIGAFKNYEEAVGAIVRWRREPVRPAREATAIYEEHYQRYRALYQANRPIMRSY